MQANIYVSSTYEDLKEYRLAVSKAIRSLGHVDVAMEYYGAEAKRPIVRCLGDVRRCDLYIGLFAFRYGYIPDGSSISITEQELRAAIKFKKDMLCFIHKEDKMLAERFIDTGTKMERLQALRNEISENYLAGFFSTPDELATIVIAAIVKALNTGYTPVDTERENRLMKEWRQGLTRMERMRARQGLKNMASPRYAAAIKDLLLETENVEDIASYMDELLELSVSSRAVMPIFVDLLQNNTNDVRYFSVFNIGELGLRGKEIHPEIVRKLMELQNDPASQIRAQLAHTLGKIHHFDTVLPEVKLCLEHLSIDPSEDVCQKAKESLGFIE